MAGLRSTLGSMFLMTTALVFGQTGSPLSAAAAEGPALYLGFLAFRYPEPSERGVWFLESSGAGKSKRVHSEDLGW